MLNAVDRATAASRLGEEETTPILSANNNQRSGSTMAKRGVIVGVTLAVTSALLLIVTAAARSGHDHGSIHVLDATATYRGPDTRLSFFVVGDWGFGKDRLQLQSAQLMNELSRTLKPDFVISTGDNVYPDGMKGKDDPKFRERFTQMYDAEGLQGPWYAVLGNHDYGDGFDHDADYSRCNGKTWAECEVMGCCASPVWQFTENRRAGDSRWHLSNGTYRMTFLDGALDIIFIDTTPFIGRHRTSAWASNIGGLLEQNTTAQRQKLEQLLQESSEGPAKWRVIVGHHGMRSYGHHCSEPLAVTDCTAMAWLGPLLEQYNVQLSLAGHDHDMQHIKFPNETTHFVVSGGGGDRRSGEFDGIDKPHAQFLADDLGFAAVEVEDDLLTVSLFTFGTGLRRAHSLQIWASSDKGGRRLRALQPQHDML